MFEIYLSTIFLWMIIIFCATISFNDSIIKNGWMNAHPEILREPDVYDVLTALILLLLVSAVPIFRAWLVAMFYLMSKYTEKQFDELVKRRIKKPDKRQEAEYDERLY